MKAKLLLYLCCIAFAVGCTKDDTIMLLAIREQNNSSDTRFEIDPILTHKITDSSIVLGVRLNNPYSVANMQIARDSLIAEGATPSSLPLVLPTHYYVRFKPANDDALAELIERDTTIIYYEYPLDYEIKEYGVSYHDPAIADTLPTYQYASVPIKKWKNLQNIPDVECTLLESLCILDEDNDIIDIIDKPFPPGAETIDTMIIKPVNPGDSTIINPNNGQNRISGQQDSDESAISLLMSKSFELTGNGDYEESSITRASTKWQPAGRITAYDNIADKQIPLVGVKVLVKRWFTTHSAITDSLGKFKCNGTFKNPANYSIIWERARYNIRDGNIVQAYYNGPKIKGDWNLNITDGKSVRFATVHRAAYRIFYGNIDNLCRPTRRINLAYIHKEGDEINGDYNRLWGLGIWSDIRIYGKNFIEGWRPLSGIFSTTCHELGHAAHHTNVYANYRNSTTAHLESWARFMEYYLTKIEYTELGVYDVYSPCINDTKYHRPDRSHNWQAWNQTLLTGSRFKLYSTYTPLYIDLYDDFNQYEYYETATNPYYPFADSNPDYSFFPNDIIHLDDISTLQYCVFKSTSFEGVKQLLMEFARSNPNVALYAFNINEKSINKLFSYYEYE